MKKLLLIGNHIGNPKDMSQRAIDALLESDMILYEYLNPFQKLCDSLGIKPKAKLVGVMEMSDYDKQQVLLYLQNDKNVTLISEAGLPMLADPGIQTAHFLFENGFDIDIIPGPSIPSIAHVLSGVKPFNSNFLFQEFMQYTTEQIPPTVEMLKPLPHTLVIIDLPAKMKQTLNICLEVLGDRNAVLLMMLTTPESEVVRGKLSDLVKYCSKNEFPKLLNTLVIAGNVTDVQ